LTTLRLHSFETGRVRSKVRTHGLLRYVPGGWSTDTLPVLAFAIEHPDGLCLFDTGQTARAATSGYHQRWHPFLWTSRFELEAADELAAQLPTRDLDPADVRWIVLSHLHTDHVGNVAAFGQAEVVVARVEWERARGIRGHLRGYIPHRWPAGVRPRTVDFGGPAVGPFASSCDLAGDGSLVLVPLPGHTPGHLGMLARGEGVNAVLAGDAAHTRAELTAVAPELAAWCEGEGIEVLLTHDADRRG
jgi:glyoxylase-like metal-dependent hydrolase (beta-lactamase superfamily II)